jgi:hypothetical protein
MSAVLHAPPLAAHTAPIAAEGSHTPATGAKGSRRCPECLAAVKPSAGAGFRNMFCCPEHRVAYHNRATVRGRVLVPLVMAARLTRDGSRGDTVTGKRAARQARTLMQRYAEEDRAGGRMPADEYAALRHRLGFDDNLC